MEETLQKLLVFPPDPAQPLPDSHYDSGIKIQLEMVQQMPSKSLVIKTPDGESILDIIDPSVHSIPYAFILIAHAQHLNKGGKITDWTTLWGKMANFLCLFDGRQMRYAGKALDQIIEEMVTCARTSNKSHLAVAPLANAILRLDPSGSVFSNRHQLLLELALESDDLVNATPVLDKFVIYFPSKQLPVEYLCMENLSPAAYITNQNNLNKKFKSQEVLEYFYNGALVYIGLRRWEDALEYLESAITYPTKDTAVSKIMVEAYKKWILVGLLAHGKALPLPKTVNANNTQKTYHALAKAYETVASIFESGTASRLKSEVEYGQKVWHDDRNTGLMLHILAAYQKNQIRNLADVYIKISIPEIQNLTTSAETGQKQSNIVVEGLVQDMITTGQLSATLSHPSNGPPVLNFSATGPNVSEADMKRELLASRDRIQFLTNEIKQTDRILTQDKEYIKWAQKEKKTKANKAEQGLAGPDVEEEALMEGLDFS